MELIVACNLKQSLAVLYDPCSIRCSLEKRKRLTHSLVLKHDFMLGSKIVNG